MLSNAHTLYTITTSCSVCIVVLYAVVSYVKLRNDELMKVTVGIQFGLGAVLAT